MVVDFLLRQGTVGERIAWPMRVEWHTIPNQKLGMVRPHGPPKNGSSGFLMRQGGPAGRPAGKGQLPTCQLRLAGEGHTRKAAAAPAGCFAHDHHRRTLREAFQVKAQIFLANLVRLRQVDSQVKTMIQIEKRIAVAIYSRENPLLAEFPNILEQVEYQSLITRDVWRRRSTVNCKTSGRA